MRGQPLISKQILQECKSSKKNLCVADYHNAFDSVPHSWTIKSLEIIGINNKIISFTRKTMSCWKKRMRLYAEEKLTETEETEI